MALSSKLKQIYGDYDNQELFYEALQLTHPNFSFPVDVMPTDVLFPSNNQNPNSTPLSTSKFLIQANDFMEFNVDGHKTVFAPYPFGVIAPEVGSDNQDLTIVFDNVSRDIIEGIELASDRSDIPIKMRYFIFVEGEADTQITPIELTLANISADLQKISATAQRADLFKYQYPTKVFDTRFRGLYL